MSKGTAGCCLRYSVNTLLALSTAMSRRLHKDVHVVSTEEKGQLPGDTSNAGSNPCTKIVVCLRLRRVPFHPDGLADGIVYDGVSFGIFFFFFSPFFFFFFSCSFSCSFFLFVLSSGMSFG